MSTGFSKATLEGGCSGFSLIRRKKNMQKKETMEFWMLRS